jgi:hypothetical protein
MVWNQAASRHGMSSAHHRRAVVLDWFSRRVLSWRVSITMEAAFCVETLEDALPRHDKPEVFNTDQGSQFTGSAFTGVLANNGIAISMDGKGAWRDNVLKRLDITGDQFLLNGTTRSGRASRQIVAVIARGILRLSACRFVFRVEGRGCHAGCCPIGRRRDHINRPGSDIHSARRNVDGLGICARNVE